MSKQFLPLLPLRDIVVFPHTAVSLYVGRSKSLKAIEHAERTEKLVFLVTQSEPQVSDPEIHHLHGLGTIARIKQVAKLPEGNVKILVEGIEKAKLIGLSTSNSHLIAEIESLGPDLEDLTSAERMLMRTLISHFESYLKQSGRPLDELFKSLDNINSAHHLCDIIGSQVSLKLREKQRILEILSPTDRLEALSLAILSEIEIIKLDRKLKGKVKEQIEKSQKDYYLQEQLSAIHKELGHDSNDPRAEASELEKKLAAKKMPEFARERAQKEIRRLRSGGHAAETHIIRSYIDLILELPWDELSLDAKDLHQAKKILDEDHYGLKDIKDRILEFLAVRARVESHKSPILCFVGPPGVGKTSLAKSVARALNRKFEKISLGGMRDEAELRGHRRTYIGALPGKIISAIRKAGVSNPVILLDEVDKIGADFRGDPASALLEVLDPEQNKHFSDHYLDLEYDLSNVVFICTANMIETMSGPLRDRLEMIHLSGYSEQEKVQIALNYILPKTLKNHGLEPAQVPLTEEHLLFIIRNYTREAGVRGLEKRLAKLSRKFVRHSSSVSADTETFGWTSQNIEKQLGAPPYRQSDLGKFDDIGVSTGLAWTPTGGEVLRIEAVALPGKGEIQITGQLGSVMQESARAAISYIRSKSTAFAIERDYFSKNDIHIHVPQGAIPKDGPSAGIALTTAILSAIKGWKVKRKVGMTGEITLRGRVLAIGGLKEKLLGAKRAGVETIIYPIENQSDLQEIDSQILKGFELHPIFEMDEVLPVVFDLPQDFPKIEEVSALSPRGESSTAVPLSH